MICALILAAGRSHRMGRPKLLLPLGGKPVIARVADAVLRSKVDEVLVVVSPDGADLRQALSGRRLRFVLNPAPDAHMLGSVRCGWRALPRACTAALVVLGDLPGLTAELVDLLWCAHRDCQRKIIVPVYLGRRGHPILVPTHYRDEVLTQHDETGLRGLLLAHPDEVREVDVDATAILEDMDTPADYARLASRFDAGGPA
jgi:molybdenum cofactor cytidylyltransferase